MRIADHTVNRGLIPAPAPPEGLFDGVDLTTAQRRVQQEGGDPEIFAAAMSWAATALREPPARDLALTLAACAAWRAGVIGIRRDALHRAGAPASPPAAVAGALLMSAEALPGFLAAQATDPFAWTAPLPGRRVADVGGFAGLGGPWQRPPTGYGPLPHPQEFWVVADDQLHRLRADIFGHRLSLLAGDVPAPSSRRGAGIDRPAERSYLLRILA